MQAKPRDGPAVIRGATRPACLCPGYNLSAMHKGQLSMLRSAFVKNYSTGRGVIDTVLTQYSGECGIKSVVLQNFPIDAATVPVYFRITRQLGINFTLSPVLYMCFDCWSAIRSAAKKCHH